MDRRHPEHEAYLKERGEMIAAKCREAAEAERARIAAGLPATPREPWPESTWEHLRRWTAEARKRAEVAEGKCVERNES